MKTLKTFKNKTELLAEIQSFASSLQPMELSLLFQIKPKSKIILTSKALVCYNGNVIRTFHPHDYTAVQVLIDLHGVKTL